MNETAVLAMGKDSRQQSMALAHVLHRLPRCACIPDVEDLERTSLFGQDNPAGDNMQVGGLERLSSLHPGVT
jgi:hypothetical protein